MDSKATPKLDIADELREYAQECHEGWLRDRARMLDSAVSEIENLRALLDQAGVTIAAAMAKGLPPLPWKAITSPNAGVVGFSDKFIVDNNGRQLIEVWGDEPQRTLVAETILALVNQPAAQAVKITEVAKGAEDEQRKYRGSGPAGDGGPFDCGGAWGGD